jgi:hypothetical protein
MGKGLLISRPLIFQEGEAGGEGAGLRQDLSRKTQDRASQFFGASVNITVADLCYKSANESSNRNQSRNIMCAGGGGTGLRVPVLIRPAKATVNLL